MAGGRGQGAGAPVLEEQLDDLDVPVVRGGHERRLVEAVAHVHVLRVPGAQRPAQRVCTPGTSITQYSYYQYSYQ